MLSLMTYHPVLLLVIMFLLVGSSFKQEPAEGPEDFLAEQWQHMAIGC